MMVNGAQVGLGTLLQRIVQLPTPRVVFAGARAMIVSWDVGPDKVPAKLQVHYGEKGSGDALRHPGVGGKEAVTNHRVGGLQPGTLLSMRLVAELGTDGDNDGCDISSEWVSARTRHAATAHDRQLCRRVTRDDGTSCNASPDVFGRLRGQALSITGARMDCPVGLWMPSELLHGGLNAAVANFRCGDCCLPPAQHEDFGFNGLTSVAGQLYTTEMMAVVQKLRDGDAAGARVLFEEIAAGVALLAEGGMLQSIKHILRARGAPAGHCCLPLQPLTPEQEGNLNAHFQLTAVTDGG